MLTNRTSLRIIDKTIYTDALLNALESTLSKERLANYMQDCKENKQQAIELYCWNSHLAEAFHLPLQLLEVALRNVFHHELSQSFGRPWYKNIRSELITKDLLTVDRVLMKLEEKKPHYQEQDIITELTFGFWAGLLWRHYDVNLWRFSLYRAFPNAPASFSRSMVAEKIFSIAKLRNRIAHYEPIYNRPLTTLYQDILAIMSWISSEVTDWLIMQARVDRLYEEYQTFLRQNRIEV